MIIDTAVLDAARRKMREADEAVEQALEARRQARKEYEEVAQSFRVAVTAIQMKLDTPDLPRPDVIPVPPAAVAAPSVLEGLRVARPAEPAPAAVPQAEPERPPAPTLPPPPPAAPGSKALRSSVWAVIHAIPLDGDIRLENLRDTLQLTQAALNMRIIRAKRAGLIETAGWGSYRLTPEGRALRGRRLQVVPDEE